MPLSRFRSRPVTDRLRQGHFTIAAVAALTLKRPGHHHRPCFRHTAPRELSPQSRMTGRLDCIRDPETETCVTDTVQVAHARQNSFAPFAGDARGPERMRLLFSSVMSSDVPGARSRDRASPGLRDRWALDCVTINGGECRRRVRHHRGDLQDLFAAGCRRVTLGNHLLSPARSARLHRARTSARARPPSRPGPGRGQRLVGDGARPGVLGSTPMGRISLDAMDAPSPGSRKGARGSSRWLLDAIDAVIVEFSRRGDQREAADGAFLRGTRHLVSARIPCPPTADTGCCRAARPIFRISACAAITIPCLHGQGRALAALPAEDAGIAIRRRRRARVRLRDSRSRPMMRPASPPVARRCASGRICRLPCLISGIEHGFARRISAARDWPAGAPASCTRRWSTSASPSSCAP